MTAIATTAPAAAAPTTRLRMTARGRRALALLVAAPVLAAGALAGADPRDVIAEIEMLNGIAGAIQPGATDWAICHSD